MHKLVLLFLFLQSLFIRHLFNNDFSKDHNFASNINLDHDDLKVSISKNNDKYYFKIDNKRYGGDEYIPYSYSMQGDYYKLGNNLSIENEITSENINNTYDVFFINYPRNYSFDESKFSYTVTSRTTTANIKLKPTGDGVDLRSEYYNFTYNCYNYRNFLNRDSITLSYYKYVEQWQGKVVTMSYSFEEQKEKFVREVVNEINNSYFYKSNSFSFNLNNYLDLSSYKNDIKSFSSRIPKNNIYYWYQGLVPSKDTTKESIYVDYAFESYDNAYDVILDKYMDILFDENNSHTSESAYSVNGFLDELIYCNEKYSNIKIYSGYLSKDIYSKNDFYLLRIPGTYDKPVAILKEWIPNGYTIETYLKEILRFYIIDNQVIRKCTYSTPLSERASEYENNSVYDKDTIFIDSLDIKDIKKDINCEINFTWLSITHKVVNANGTYKVSTTNYKNETDISFDDYGYYKVVENTFQKTNTLNDIIIKDNKRSSLCIKSESSLLSDDLFNKETNQVFLTNKTNSDIPLSFPYYDSSLISIKHNGKETELFNYINYNLTSNDSFISFPKYTITEEGKYVISISNRWGLTSTFQISISNSKTNVDIKATNEFFSLEINTPDGGLNNVVSFMIQRAFYKKEESLVQYEQISSSTPYIYEDINEKSNYINFSKSKEEYFINNVFTFYPRENEYQIIKIYLKDNYGNIIDSIYKWNFVPTLEKESSGEIEVSLDSTNVEIGSTISYLPFYKNTKKEISSSDYEVEIINGKENIEIDNELKVIKGIKIGESKIAFSFYLDNEIPIKKEYKINVTNKNQNSKNTSNKNSSLLFIIIPASVIVIVSFVFAFKYLNKRKSTPKLNKNE